MAVFAASPENPPMEAQVLSILAVSCVDCGDAERLVTVTNDSVIKSLLRLR
jgi:hypothetical protein